MINIPYIVTGNAITAYTPKQALTVRRSERADAYNAAYAAIKNGDEDALIEALSPAVSVQRAFASVLGAEVELTETELLLNGQPLDDYTARKALDFAREGLDVSPIMNFIARMDRNPSFRARRETYGFLEYGNMPLTPDGCFLAYKRVRADYKDVYTGTIDNSVGSRVIMDRRNVDDNSQNTCSYGLHFCSFEYLRHFSGERIMVLKIDPADVVSIPVDYNNTKGRCSAYEVVGEMEVPEEWNRPVVDDYERDYDPYDEDEEEEAYW